jgi:DNA polymerase-3 subunit epsilon
MDFVAFDFETATRKRDSACALGIVVVINGIVTAERKWHLRPHNLRFDIRNARLHGITTVSVRDCPSLEEAWNDILPYLSGRVLVAHYAQFDISVLQSTLNRYDIHYPPIPYSCSRLIAKRTWPDFRHFSLAYLSRRLSLQMQHHDALADAHTCAAIILAASRKHAARTLAELEATLSIRRGCLSVNDHRRVST